MVSTIASYGMVRYVPCVPYVARVELEIVLLVDRSSVIGLTLVYLAQGYFVYESLAQGLAH